MDLNAQGIRLNCISPGPTDTPMMPAFEDLAGGAQIIDLFAQGLGRRSTPAEQGWPMIFLNSDAASYISGENVNTDGGTVSAMTTGPSRARLRPRNPAQQLARHQLEPGRVRVARRDQGRGPAPQ